MIKFIVIKGNSAYDMSQLVTSVKWSGRRGSAARSLSVTFIDDDGFGHERSGIDVSEGHKGIFYWKDEELFRGLFCSQSQSGNKTMPLTANDIGIYLSNNKDTFVYANKTASDILKDCCTRFQIPMGTIVDTKYIISDLTKPKTTVWDVICDALSITYKSTGVRYYVVVKDDTVSLIERRENILQWLIEPGSNLISYTYTKKIDNIKTRIKVYSKEDEVLAEASDTALESKIGIFQDVESISDDMNEPQAQELANTTLEKNNKPEETLSLSGLGIPDVISGTGVYIKLPALDIAKTYYVEEDTHTFTGNYHSMSLKLSLATDVE